MNLFKIQLILFLALLILWNVFTPVLEGADESGHFCQADYIAHRNKLPNLYIQDGCFLWHSPLYYLTLVPFIKIFNQPEFSEKDIKSNPRFTFLRRGEYAQFVHDRNELLLKWNSFQTMNHLLRFISSLSAIGMFLIAWRLSSIVFKNRLQKNLSLLLFFNPMFLHIFTTITNVTLVSLIVSLFIAVDLIYTNKVRPRRMSFFQGVLLGLGYITKISIVGLLFAWVYLFYLRLTSSRKNFFAKFDESALFILGFLLTAGWYIVRNVRLYGEILEVNVLAKISGPGHHDLLLEKIGLLNYLNSFFLTLFRTFWSGYGALTIRFPEVINLILLLISLFMAYAVIAKLTTMNKGLKICLYYFLSMLFGLFIMNFRLAAMHAKDIFPVYIPIAFLFSFGVIQVSNVLKSINLKSYINLLILFLAIYFFAQYEIIRAAKFTFQRLGIVGFYTYEGIDIGQILINFASKIVLVLMIYWVIHQLVKKIIITQKFIYITTLTIFGLNLVIIAFSTYLFYFKFI